MIFTVSNLKGGSGKTTSAIYLAHALVEVGRPVVLIDADPSGAATGWADKAEDDDSPLPFEVIPLANPKMGKRVLALAETQDVIVDAPPSEAAIVTAAIKVSDFVLIPTNPRPLDCDEAVAIAEEALSQGKPSAAFFVRVRPQESSMVTCREMLKAQDVDIFETKVHELTSIGWSPGASVSNIEPYDKLLGEVLEVLGHE